MEPGTYAYVHVQVQCRLDGRISPQLKLKPPGSENAIIDNFVPILQKGRYKIGKLPEEREAEERERREKERQKEEKNRNPKKDF